MQLFGRSGAVLNIQDYIAADAPTRLEQRFSFRMSRAWAVGSALVFLSAWFAMSNLSPFIYYQF
jgi:hypothetical protein